MMWRRRVLILLSIVGGVLIFQDARLALAYRHGVMIRVVVDKELGNGVVKSHITQIPSTEDTLAMLCWGMIHAGIAICWRSVWASGPAVSAKSRT